MSLFDPLGFITPLKVKGLIIFQKTYELQLGWDDEVTAEIEFKWQEWIEELAQINSLQIPRSFLKSFATTSTYELHVFCDASEEAYAAAAYLREDTGGSVHTALLASKGRVKPLKGLSVPRMELQAALLGTRLAVFIKEAFADDLFINRTIFWSDSRTVLCWVNSETGRFSQYVSNRLNEIMISTQPSDWRWVPSLQNVADDATRSRKEIVLTNDSRWFTGAEFLSEGEECWPRQELSVVAEKDLEIKSSVMVVQTVAKRLPLPQVEVFSCWWRLIKKTASWIRGVRLLQKKLPRVITLSDICHAQHLWAKQVQHDSFNKEIELMARGERPPRSSRLLRLMPFLNKDGLLVIKGRMSNTSFPDTVKHPIILDSRHRYTQLLIMWHHAINGHQGQETVLAELRNKYWIIDARAAVRGLIAKCLTCKIKKASTAIPPSMGDLPESRLAINQPPFTHTGVDLFGPMEVTIGRRKEKRWGVIFTCMTTRATYLDLVPSLSTSDFIDCFVRFNCRRGPATHLWSDNGTNFRGADKELRDLVEKWNQKELEDKLLYRGVEWHFNPPSSPHMGGAWERIIGLAKRILADLLKEKTPKEYTLLTLLVEIENILNSRPLTNVSSDPKDPNPITPNHLLKLRCVPGGLVPGDLDQSNSKMWRYAQCLAQDFWKRWRSEYLPTLNQRKKWQQEQIPIREGDLVVMADDQSKRNEWKKGIITKTFPGKDGIVRVVQVRVANPDGVSKNFLEYIRPVVKVCPLGFNVKE